jgi:hypothetical protein
MSCTLINNKKGRQFENRVPFTDKISNSPSAHNPAYKKSLNVGCTFCKDKSGRKKNFKTLWCLYMHMKTHHDTEQSLKDLVMQLADLVNKGVLL